MNKIGWPTQISQDKLKIDLEVYSSQISKAVFTIARELGMKGVKFGDKIISGGNENASNYKFGPRTTPETGSKYAYTFLLMKGDRYLKGVLVGGHSVRKHSNYCKENKCDIVCMITPDVSNSAYEILKRVFDRIIEVPYIEHKSLEMKGEK
jgi:hypothetical protein